jgi:LysW-gamma-L-lysine carboxypeptidase
MEGAVDLIRGLVSIPSVTGDTQESVRFLLDWCRRNGMEAVIDSGALVVNPRARGLLLLGHIDTVPGEVPVRIEDGHLWGRGSVDAKGPLCAALFALSRMPDIWDRVMLVACPDEEGDSSSAKRLRDSLPQMPCVVLEPGGWEGITISYRGRVEADLIAEARRSHSGSESPFSAELALARLSELSSKNRVRVLHMHGDIERSEVRLDLRYRMGERPELANDGGTWFYVIEDTPPYRSDKGSPLVRAFLGSIREEGGSPQFKNKTGTSDMNTIGERWTTPIVAYGPGDSALDHTGEERVSIPEYLRSISVISRVMERLAK